ncbi:MAG: hypothetical protein M3018_01625 [Actinomycetota bacterium]|nr:hypothetical protein [Actinomycetota bacterium]
MGTWTTQARMVGPPDDVLEILTRPEAIARWAPFPFEVRDFNRDRLVAGDLLQVTGVLSGHRVEFDVEVVVARDGWLALQATGPIDLDVEYVARPYERGSMLRATVEVTGRGLVGRLLASATEALLAAGALNTAIGRIAHELEPALAA